MAIVSGSVGAVAGIGKLLAGGLTKKKIMQGAGDALKNTAKGAVKRGMSRKKKRGGPGSPDGEGGDIIQSPSGSIVPTSPLMGDIIIPYPEEPAKTRPKPVGVVDYNSISEQLQSIVALTAAIEQVTGKSIKAKKKIKDTNRKNQEKAAKRDKENRLAGAAGGALGYLGGKLGEVAEASGIMQFLSNIITGFVVVNLLPMIPGILNAIKFIGSNAHYFFLGFKGVGLAIGEGVKAFGKAMPPIIDDLKNAGKPITEAFKKAGDRIKNLFTALGKVVPNFIKTGFGAVKNAVTGVGDFIKNIGRGGRTAQQLASAKSLEKLTGTAGKGVQQATTGALQMRRMHGDEAARMYKGLMDNGMSNAKASKYVMNQIKAGKLTSAPLKGSLAGGISGSKIFKGGPIKAGKRAVIKYLGKGPVVKKALRNIPVIGPIIVGVTSLLSGEPAAQALFKVGGTLVGGILGAFIPIPILGPIIGEILGEYVGDLMYVLLMGGGPNAVMDRMKQDITAVMSAGSMAMDWVGRGFDRFMKGIPKLEMPGIIPTWLIPEELRSIPNPLWLLNPMNILDKMGLFWKSFFTDDPISPGREENKKDDEGGSSKKPVRGHFRRGPSGKKEYEAAMAKWKAENGETSITPEMPDSPPGATPPSTSGNETPPTQLAERSGSDPSGLTKVPQSSSSSVTEYNATGGNKNRKIFLHWTAGHHNQPYSSYHTVFLGSGKAVRYTPYGQDKKSHTAGGNTGSIGLSLAAMAGGGENQKSWAVPPTSAQIDAMVTEAAQIALDWGWDSSTVDKNVMTHGEWERHATRSGILPAPAQRWDLDKLKPSDPAIDTSKVPSHGGNTMRAKIKAKMQALKSGGLNNEERQEPQEKPDTPPAPSPVKKPDKKDYKGRSGAAQYAKDMMAFKAQEDKKDEKREKIPMVPDQSTVKPVTPKAGDIKPEKEELPKPDRKDYKGRSGAAAYAKAMEQYENSKKESEDTEVEQKNTYEVSGVTYDSATGRPVEGQDLSGETHEPEITPSQPPANAPQSVQRQASYEQPGGGGVQAPIMLPPKQTQMATSGGGGQAVPLGSGNVLNSYYKSQLLGFLYKQG